MHLWPGEPLGGEILKVINYKGWDIAPDGLRGVFALPAIPVPSSLPVGAKVGLALKVGKKRKLRSVRFLGFRFDDACQCGVCDPEKVAIFSKGG